MRMFQGVLLLTVLSVPVCVSAQAQQQQQRPRAVVAQRKSHSASLLTGVYRLDLASSDRLYSVVAGASSNLPFAEQQRFFIDLTTRLTPPDQLAIERRGDVISLASSRAPQMTFEADGWDRVERAADGETRVRAATYGENLVINSRSSTGETYKVTFAPSDDGKRLLVTRRISTKELSQPVTIRSVYHKISDIARWEIYGEPAGAPETARPVIAAVVNETAPAVAEREAANDLRAALGDWIAATNARDLRGQMSFYVPTLQAFYLKRSVPKDAVRAEKARVFERAQSIAVSAEEPEILFGEGGSTAVMRFRKRYAIEGGPRNRRGEVVQELRWRQTNTGWKIFSERDVRVIR